MCKVIYKTARNFLTRKTVRSKLKRPNSRTLRRKLARLGSRKMLKTKTFPS